MNKNLLKKRDFFLAFLAFLFVFSCRQELENIGREHNHNHFNQRWNKTRILKGKEAEKISNLLQLQLEKYGSKFLARRSESGEVDYSEITEVIDSLGIANYTFRITNHPADDYKTFHNLVLTNNDSTLEVHLVKYEMTESLAQAVQQNGKMNYFEGTVQATDLSKGLDPGEGGGGSPGNDCPPISTGGEGGGGSTPGSENGETDSGSDSGGGGGGSCTVLDISYTCGNCGANYGSWGEVQGSACGGGKYPIIINISYRTLSACRQSNKGRDLSPCAVEGTFAVNVQFNSQCLKIKASTANTKYKNNITDLEGRTNQNYESGYRLNFPVPGSGQTDTQNQLLQNKPGTSVLNFTYSNNTFALMHSHYDKLFPMFSPGDILEFNEWIAWAITWNADPANNPKIPVNNLTLTVVTSQGNYLFAFDGTSVDALPNYTKDELKKLNDTYIDDLSKSVTIANVSGARSYDMERMEKDFLKFIQKSMNMPGLKLYKVESTGNTEIYLENKNRKIKKCP